MAIVVFVPNALSLSLSLSLSLCVCVCVSPTLSTVLGASLTYFRLHRFCGCLPCPPGPVLCLSRPSSRWRLDRWRRSNPAVTVVRAGSQ